MVILLFLVYYRLGCFCWILPGVIFLFVRYVYFVFFFFQAEDGIRDYKVTGVQTCALPISHARFNESEAAERTAAIAAHQHELSARLERNVGLSVAALDYLLNISGDLVAPAIVEHEILEVLEHRSVTDPLTGLFNRYHFEATLKRETARCLRYQSRLSLLLMDVDQLKAVNDRWGHPAGDQMLVRVAGAIRDSLRGCDTASRYGGDEFAVILPDTDARAARLVAERICDKVGASDAPIKVTVSGGLADLSPAARGSSEARLIAAADRALYLARGGGGNCVAEEVLPCRD